MTLDNSDPTLALTLTPLQQVLHPTGTLLVGVAMAWLTWQVQRMVAREVRQSAESWEHHERRRLRIRQRHRVFRWIEPLVDEMREHAPLHRLANLARVERDLRISHQPSPWSGDEFVATTACESILLAILVATVLSCFGNVVQGIFVGGTLGVAYFHFSLHRLHDSARARMRQLKQRLPFAVDLMALMMEAGAGFRDALATIAQEYGRHPIGVEFARIVRGLNGGQSLRAKLTELQMHLQDPDISEMVFAITKAEELGTPLTRIFRSQADQMRLKRSQWAEAAAGRAQTMLTFPMILVMGASLLVVVVPFLIDALTNYSL